MEKKLKYEFAFTIPDCDDWKLEEVWIPGKGMKVLCKERFYCKNHDPEKCKGVKKCK